MAKEEKIFLIKILVFVLCVAAMVIGGGYLVKINHPIPGWILIIGGILVWLSCCSDRENQETWVGNFIRILGGLICIVMVLGFVVLGFFIGGLVIDKAQIVTYSWYQPSEGPNMGQWQLGSDENFIPVLIYFVFAGLGGALGGGVVYLIWKCFDFLAKRLDSFAKKTGISE
jgi:hypothetical protein